MLQFKQISPGEPIMEFGDDVDAMYLLLKGRAKAIIRNEAITNWDWIASINNALVEWKE